MTAPTDPPQTEVPDLDGIRRKNRLLSVTVIVLAMALIGVGVWSVFNATNTSEAAPTGEIDQFLDDYYAATNQYDAATLERLFTTEFRGYEANSRLFRRSDGSLDLQVLSHAAWVEVNLDEILNGLGGYSLVEASIDALGEPIVVGDGPWLVAQAYRWNTPMGVSPGSYGITTYTIVDEGGTLKIARVVGPSLPIE